MSTLSIRRPDDLKYKVMRLAKKKNMSFNGLVNHWLQAAVTQDETFEWMKKRLQGKDSKLLLRFWPMAEPIETNVVATQTAARVVILQARKKMSVEPLLKSCLMAVCAPKLWMPSAMIRSRAASAASNQRSFNRDVFIAFSSIPVSG